MQFNTLSCRLLPALPTKPQNPAASLGKMNQFSWVIHRKLFTSFTLRLSLPLDQQGEPIHTAAGVSEEAGGHNLPSDQLGANKILAPQAKQSVKSHQLLSLGAFCQGERQVSFCFTFHVSCC